MKIPAQMQPVYEEIAGMIDEYCGKYLNEEYRALCLRLLEKLCRKRPSPLLKGRRNTWAAGIVYAIAANNFIFDKSMPVHLTADELSRPFGVAPSTAGNKAAEIRKLVRMSPWDTEWLLQELIEDNPAIWMLSVDGFIVDARDLPLEFQQEAARRGLIPYVPAPRQKKEQPEQHSEKTNLPAPSSSKTCVPDDSPSEPAPPADFSDIYDRFRTV
jgi:hypothetical protein